MKHYTTQDFQREKKIFESFISVYNEFGEEYPIGWHETFGLFMDGQYIILEALTRCTQEQRPAEGWQPMETAPKDGTRVLFWDGVLQKVGEWKDDSYEEEQLVKETKSGKRIYEMVRIESGYWDIDDYEISPELWQPLPAAPTYSPQGGKQ